MDDGEKPKPREIYIPPEIAATEEELYNSGISSGINFDKYDRIDIKVRYFH
jgi:probable ATP-dependent RNA helicase DDX4